MQHPWKTPNLDRDLLGRHAPGPERGGVILDDGTVVEMTNRCQEGASSCVLDPMEILAVEDRLAATWHTHPNSTGDLSGVDWETFTNWPDLLHCIVGSDGPRWYAVKGRAVVNAA